MKTIQLSFTFILIILFASILTGCNKEDEKITVSDIDENVYKTIKIGSKVWMAEDLRTTKFNDGSTISVITDNTSWSNLTTAASCDYDNLPANSQIYGKLYNWYVVNDSRKLCPSGWHVPSETEWAEFVAALGGYDVAGGKMKEKGTAHWSSPNSGATNTSGFSALGAGYRNYLGVFKDQTYTAGFWTSTESNTSYAYHRSVFFDLSAVDGYAINKKTGLSVRCVKD